VDDTDCGGPDDGWACFSVDAYQRVCFDGVATACQTDADCPQAPSGKHGRCLDESDGVEPTSTLYKKCYLPKLGADAGYGCW
jgi:hypothetical protein